MDVKKFSKDTLLTFGTRVIGLASSILVNIIIARTLGPAGKGIATMVFMYPFFAFQILSMGLGRASTYYISREKNSLSLASGNLVAHTLLMSSIFLIFSILFSGWITTTFFKIDIQKIFFISVLIFPFLHVSNITANFFMGLKNFKKYNLLIVTPYLARVPFIILFLILLQQQFLGCAYYQISAIVCTFIVAFILLFKKINTKINFTLPFYKKSLVYGVKSQAGVIIQQFNLRLDHFLIVSLTSLSDLGIYSMGVLATEILWYIPDSFARVLFPRVASTTSKSQIRQNAYLIIRTSTWILIIASIILAFSGRFFISLLLGTEFFPSYYVILFLLPGTIMLGISKISASVLHGLGKPEFGSYLSVFGITATIALDILLIPRMGIIGAAIASTTAYSIMGIAGLIFLMTHIGGNIKDYFSPKLMEIKNLLRILIKR